MITLNEIAAGALKEKLENARIGVVIKGIADIVPYTIAAVVADALGRTLLAAIVGYNSVDMQNEMVVAEDNIEKAVEWRSIPDNAGRIVVFVKTEMPKMHSLSDLDVLTTRDLSLWLIDWIANETAQNTPTRDFWNMLKHEVSAFPLSMLEDFISAVYTERQDYEAISNNLWRLGLLKDDKILDSNKNSIERFRQNRELLIKMGQLSEESRRKISSTLSKASAQNKERLTKSYKGLQEFYRRGGIEPLRELSFEAVSELLVSSKRPAPSPVPPVDEPSQGEAPTNTTPPPHTDINNTNIRGRELAEEIGRHLLMNNEEGENALNDLADYLRGYLADQRGDIPSTTMPERGFGGRSVELEKPDSDIRRLIGYACSADTWGGLCKTDCLLLKDAIRKAKPEDIIKYDPNSEQQGVLSQSFFSLLKSCDRYIESGDKFDAILEKLVAARNILAEQIDMIISYPFVLFGGDAAVRTALFDYIEAYSVLYRCFKDNPVHREDPQVARFIANEILRLEVIYIKTPKEWKAILTPLHPFNLWRFYELIKSVREENDSLTETEQSQLSKALPQLPHLLHYLVKASDEFDSETITLPQSGSMGSLPTYENKTNRFLGNDGVEFIKDLLNRWIAFSPYTRHEIRISLFDTPDIHQSLKMVLEFLKESTICERVVVDTYFTRGQNIGGELARIDYDDKDHELSERLKDGSLVLHWYMKDSLSDAVNALNNRPAHIAYFFDQSQYKIGYGPNIRQLYVSPLVVSYDYEYSDAMHRGTIAPSSQAETGLFGDYHAIINFAAPMPAGQSLRMTFNATVDLQPINNILAGENAVWLVVADRVLTPYAPVAAIPLGEQRSGQRDLGVWASSSSKVVEQYKDLLRRYNLYPEEGLLSKLIYNFAHIASGGIISLPRYGGSTDVLEKKRKGLLGTVFAAAWYTKKYPGALVASLDSKLARLWLSSRGDSEERADLIGLRVENDSLIIEPIEVKTHKDLDDIREVIDSNGQKRLEGKPVSQIEAMLKVLSSVFLEEASQSIFTPARREVLKYQLHTECFREVHDRNWQKDWYLRLKAAFAIPCSIVPQIQGLIIHVFLEENGECEIMNYDPQSLSLVILKSKDVQALINPISSIDNAEATSPQSASTTEENIENQADMEVNPIGAEQGQSTNEEVYAPVEATRAESVPIREAGYIYVTTPMEDVNEIARSFRRAAQGYRIQVEDCDPNRAIVGPSVIRFYVRLARGQSLDPLRNNLEDIGREMCRSNLLVNTILNSNEISLDIPRAQREFMPLSRGLERLPSITSPEQLYFPIGVTPEGQDLIRNLGEMPHLLVGGSTGSGKTVLLYSLLTALIQTHPEPSSMRLFLSSSGLEDFIFFEGLPHLETGRIITDAREAVELIQNLISTEFDRRAQILTEARCPNIIEYNRNNEDKMPPLVVVVDEFADLTDQLGRNKDAFYTNIRRIAQIGRKRGIHLVLCTQRPSANLVPTDIRSQMNSRIALRVNDAASSRMILELPGAQNLQNKGDLLYKENENMMRAQGYYITARELDSLLANYRR